MTPPISSTNARWPRAMAVLTEEPLRGAPGCKLLTLMAEAGYCEDCGWRGPLRGPKESHRAALDAVAHWEEEHRQ